MGVLQRSLQGVEVALSLGDPVEKMNKFMRNRVFMEKGDLFDCVEDNGGFEDGSVERVNSM